MGTYYKKQCQWNDPTFYLQVNTLFADNLKEAANLNTALFGGNSYGGRR